MSTETVQPIEQKEIRFYGDEIVAVQAADGTIYVPIRPIYTFMGVDWNGQRRRNTWLMHADGGAWLKTLLAKADTQQPGEHIARFLRQADEAEAPPLATIIAAIGAFQSAMLRSIMPFDALICPVEATTPVRHGHTASPDTNAGWGHMNAFDILPTNEFGGF